MKIFLDTNIFPEFIDRRVTTGSGHFVTVTKYPDPDVTRVFARHYSIDYGRSRGRFY